MNDRPDFELVSDDHPMIDSHKMLTRPHELAGHTIKACVEAPSGAFAEPGSIVLVTETGCWAVLTVRGYSLEDSSVELDSKAETGGGFGSSSPRRDLTLHDFLDAHDMRQEGIIGDAEYQLLLKKEQDAEQAKKLAKAEQLRRELARLEGGEA